MRFFFITLSIAITLTIVPTCTPGINKTMQNLPTCITLTSCSQHDGERVSVIGIYTVWDPLPDRARNHPPAQQVIIQFAHEEGPFLGAWGHSGHMRPLDEIVRYKGKKVRVTGKFLRQMPTQGTFSPEVASLNGPCIHPVENIAFAE